MPTLILASRSVVYDRALADAAAASGWNIVICDRDTLPSECNDAVVYVTIDLALAAAKQLQLTLLEPPFDLLARIPVRFRRRQVEFSNFGELVRLRQRTFVKPADPLDKWFDAGTYSDIRDINTRGRVRPETPVLLSELVEWSAEYRCFVLDGKVIAESPYLSFGRPSWKPFDPRRASGGVPKPGLAVVEGLCTAMRGQLPPAFVVDVGLIEDRGWAVVEFNPIWCSGLLAADPQAILPVLKRATRPKGKLTQSDRKWVVRECFESHHSPPPPGLRSPSS